MKAHSCVARYHGCPQVIVRTSRNSPQGESPKVRITQPPQDLEDHPSHINSIDKASKHTLRTPDVWLTVQHSGLTFITDYYTVCYCL